MTKVLKKSPWPKEKAIYPRNARRGEEFSSWKKEVSESRQFDIFSLSASYNLLKSHSGWDSSTHRYLEQKYTHMASRIISDPSSRDFLSGGGELGERMRNRNWSETKLGPIDEWPQSLRTSVSICLASKFPIVLYWGSEYVVLYNDAYSAILGSKHPWALGQRCADCWAEIWDTIGPMLNGVATTGLATWSNDLLLPLKRFGYSEECYFSFSFSPVRIEDGSIGGVFTAVIETSERLIAERRLNTLRELASRVADADTEEKMCSMAMETLSKNQYDVSFAVFYLLGPDGKRAEPRGCCGISDRHILCREASELESNGTDVFAAVSRAIRTAVAVEMTDLDGKCPDLPTGLWGVVPVEAVALPIILPGYTEATGCLLVGLNARKRLDREYRAFLEMMASQLAGNLSAARTHAAEKERAESLAKLDRAKTAFFSNVSHEFRTPLTLMVGPLESLMDRASPYATVGKDEIQLVHRNSMRLLKLVNTLLDFSRIEAGRMEAIYEPTNLSSLTSDTASAFRSAMEQAGLEFVVDCPPMDESCYVDRDLWEKIVLNLISNAFKFTLAGRIAVRLRSRADQFELRVEDTGLGIPEELQSKVFERFHRIEGVRGRTHEGSGIGLALVQELVRLHKGFIRVESAVGKGSTFVVSIPKGHAHLPGDRIGTRGRILKSAGVSASAYVDEALRWLPETERPADARPVFASDSVQAPHLQTTTGRILVADDNADMRGYIRRLLGESYDIEIVSNGVEALAAIRARQHDLVLTDVMMPELDGFGLLRELRADNSTSTIPVILLSARAGEEARIEGMEAGADDYIVKPFTARELLARVGAHLALSRLRKEGAERERALREELEIRVEQRTAQLQSANLQLRELSSRLQQLRDDERRRLARELHDSAGQLLAAISMNMAMIKTEAQKLSPEMARRLDENAAIVEQLTSGIRTISHLLHPPLLDEVGLASALRWYVEGFAQRSKLQAVIEVPETLDRFSPEMEIAVFRAVQESLTNVHRHSGSSSCSVKVSVENNLLQVEIRDNGRGISTEKQSALGTRGVGIRGMQERLRSLGGTLEIQSSEKGTTVTVSLPVPSPVNSGAEEVA